MPTRRNRTASNPSGFYCGNTSGSQELGVQSEFVEGMDQIGGLFRHSSDDSFVSRFDFRDAKLGSLTADPPCITGVTQQGASEAKLAKRTLTKMRENSNNEAKLGMYPNPRNQAL